MSPETPAAQRTRVITLIAQFGALARLMADEVTDRIRRAGYADITNAQHLVFENIDPDGTRLTTLATRAGITRQSVTELVTALERNGYVAVRSDPADRRARRVHLTRKGRALVRRAIEEIAAVEADWQESFRRAGADLDLSELLRRAIDAHTALETDPRAA